MSVLDTHCSRRHMLASLVLACPSARCVATGNRAPSSVAAMVSLMSEARPDINPSGYLVSEKLDGVRALWDGSTLRFRSGRLVAAPSWFIDALPATALDGELWGGRGSFDAVSGVVRRTRPGDAGWRSLRLMVFDLPGAPGDFASRAVQIREWMRGAPSAVVAAVEQTESPDGRSLQGRLDAVVQGGGEGLVLHRANAPWAPGRSESLLKLKPLHDAEAQVLAHESGHGRLAHSMGALRVRTAAGIEFRIGTGFTDQQRRYPPPVGSWITYTHRGLTPAGVPRFASYWRPHEPGL